jgi:hypothetical protein
VLGGATCLLVTSLGHAECRMDNDCAGELVCENATCVAPRSVAPPAPAPAAVAPQPTTAPPPNQAPARQSREPPAEAPLPRRGKRHSQGMFVTGIVITSLAPIGLIVTGLGMMCGLMSTSDTRGGDDCGQLLVGGLVTTAVLAGVGIPLIVIGAKRDPVAIGRVAPWVTPRGAGVGLRFDL